MAIDKSSFTIRKEHPGTKAARMLIGELDAYLDPLYPKESQHGYSIEKLVAQRVEFFVLYEDEAPAACGGVQFFDDSTQTGESYGEIKRMYVRPEFRGRGYAKQMLKHLEELADRQRIFQGAPGNRHFPAGSHRSLRAERLLQDPAVRRLLGRPTQLLLRKKLRQLTAAPRIRNPASLRQIPPVHLHQVPVHVRSRV